MNEQIQKDLDALAQQKEIFARDLSNATDQTVITALQGEIDAVDAKITAKQAEAAQLQQAHDQVVEAAKEEIAGAFEAISFEGETYTIEAFAENEVAAMALKNFFTEKFAQQADAFNRQNTEIKAERDAARKAEQEARDLTQSLKEQLAQAILDKEDAEAKRDAAVRETESVKAELAAKESAVATSISNTDSGAVKDAMQKWKESRPAVYDVQPVDTLKKRFSAKLAETGEPIEYGFLEKGKYREVSEEEAKAIAARFQAEQTAADAAPGAEQAPADQASAEPAQTDGNADSPLVVPPIVLPDSQFQGSTDAGAGVAQTEPSVEVPGQTIEERVAALETRVAALEGKQVNGAAA